MSPLLNAIAYAFGRGMWLWLAPMVFVFVIFSAATVLTTNLSVLLSLDSGTQKTPVFGYRMF